MNSKQRNGFHARRGSVKTVVVGVLALGAIGVLVWQMIGDSQSFETLNETNANALVCDACEHRFFLSDRKLAEAAAGRAYEMAPDGRTMMFACESCGSYRAVREAQRERMDQAPPIPGSAGAP